MVKGLHGLHLTGLFSLKTKTIYLDSGIPLNCLRFMSAVRHQEEQHEKVVFATMQIRCKHLLAGDFFPGCPFVTVSPKERSHIPQSAPKLQVNLSVLMPSCFPWAMCAALFTGKTLLCNEWEICGSSTSATSGFSWLPTTVFHKVLQL